MEAMSIPVTAIIAIVIACIVLAMAFIEQDITFPPRGAEVKNIAVHPSEGEKIVWRFLMSDRNDSAALFHDLAASFGHRTESLARRALDKWIVMGKSRVDRAYALKGYTFSRLGDQTEAERYYRLALVKNPGCSLAKLGLARFVASETPIDNIEMIRSSGSGYKGKVEEVFSRM